MEEPTVAHGDISFPTPLSPIDTGRSPYLDYERVSRERSITTPNRQWSVLFGIGVITKTLHFTVTALTNDDSKGIYSSIRGRWSTGRIRAPDIMDTTATFH